MSKLSTEEIRSLIDVNDENNAHRPSDELINKYLTRRYSQDKYGKMKAIVLSQLQKYSESGERLYQIGSLDIRQQDAREYAKLLLEEIFRDGSKSGIVYNLIFGRAQLSYHIIKLRCNKAGYKLKTTPMEWFYSIPDRIELGIYYSKVKVECEHGHEVYKVISSIGRHGCFACVTEQLIEEGWYKNLPKVEIEYDGVARYFERTPFELALNKRQFNDAIMEAKSKGKKPSHAVLRLRHKECGHEFPRSYRNMIRSFSCPKCTQKKNQKITHGLCVYIFDSPFEVEKSMKKIFDINDPEIIIDLHDNVHIDISQELSNLKDKYGNPARDRNGNVIKLGVRYNGEQHQNSPEGFRAYLGISKHSDVEYRSGKWREAWKQWRLLIKTDQIKRDVYEKNKKYGYYLIEINYNIPKSQRLVYIYSQFEQQTGVELERKENIDWRLLL